MNETIELTAQAGALEHLEAMARKPFAIDAERMLFAVPDGYSIDDHSKLLPAPARKAGTTALHDVQSFIAQVKRHGSLADCVVYVDADYARQHVQAVAVFNDHGEDAAGWRDHRAVFVPRFTEEWKRWIAQTGKPMTQTEFGFFLEANLADIAEPAGGEVLNFVLTLQETRKVKYGSAVNLANGMVQLEFTEEGDSATKGKLEVFRKFTLGLRPFAGGAPYSVDALLRYRIDRNSGEIKFWFDLQRPDRVLEDACRETVDLIRTQAGVPLLYGTP
ncbi:DUF2303 family protein [Thauera aromatica]|uniref:DUF2303 family protein n=1 Tax=Thauera aromatica TaxID=59405 RepID=UPI001FFDA0FD|nr:DUF2303 family protein [Thauera aromatica]MCK2095194.1 YfdQ family protein [Thauera aromatica]